MKLFELPPPVGKTMSKKKDLNSLPDYSMLNEGQAEAFESLEEFIKDEDSVSNMILLKGWAGTGKTFMLSKLIQKIMFEHPAASVCFSAPTNKAVKVLYRMADWHSPKLTYNTVHSLLGLTEQINADGTISFVQRKDFIPDIDKFKILVVDEVSMLPDELFHKLAPFAELGVKIIFTGDPAQIPPVKRKKSIVLTEEGQEAFGWEIIELREIMRQVADNPIVKIATKVRNRLHVMESLKPQDRVDEVYGDELGVRFIETVTSDQRKAYIKLLRHLFTSDNFKKDPDFAKVLCYTNATVKRDNQIVHRMIYGKESEIIAEGEYLVMQEPYLEDTKVIINNAEEIRVQKFHRDIYEIEDDSSDESIKIEYFNTEVLFYRIDGTPVNVRIRILTPEGKEVHEEICDGLLTLAKQEQEISKYNPSNRINSARAWSQYYEFKRLFANWNYNYAITMHKSQGSTYENVISHLSETSGIRNITEKNNIKYTAISRAKHRLYIL